MSDLAKASWRADLRLAPSAVACWAAAAWAVGAGFPAAVLVAASCAAAGLLLLCGSLLRRGALPWWGRTVPAVCVVLLTGSLVIASSAVHNRIRAPPDLTKQLALQRSYAVQMEVARPPETAPTPDRFSGRDRTVVTVRLTAIDGRPAMSDLRTPVTVLAGSSWKSVRSGQTLRARVKFSVLDPGGAAVALAFPDGPPVVITEPDGYHRTTERLRSGLRSSATVLPADARGLLPGLVVGDTAGLDAGLEEAMKRTGMTHLTAVSGSNLAIFSGAVLLVGAAVGLRRGRRMLLAAGSVVGFVALVAPDPTVLRASVMAMVCLLGLGTGRSGRGLPALCLAMLLLLTADPYFSRNYGFALSVLACVGLLLCAKPFARLLARWLPDWLAFALAVPTAAQLFCSPVIILLQPAVSSYAVPANVLAAPAVASTTILGVLTIPAAQLWPPAGEFLAWWAGIGAQWIASVARFFSGLPFAQIPWPSGIGGLILLAGLTALSVGLVIVATRLKHPRIVAFVVLAGLLGAAITVPLWRPGNRWLPSDWDVVACDVGQGSGTVIRGGAGSAIVIDVGLEPEPVDRCLTTLGVERVFLILSHFDLDHVGGLEGAIAGRKVDGALLNPVRDPPATAGRVRRLLVDQKVPITVASGVMSGKVGNASYQVLWPPAGNDLPQVAANGSNAASIVVLLTVAGHTVLIPGDIEPESQATLRRRYDLDAEVLFVPHHGSKNQDARFFAELRPRLGVVSVGAGNDYGHPAPATLQLLSRARASTVRTDLCGSIALSFDPADIQVATERSC
ncbi:ComEC/Rec2 family competence protein [Saxibacter everestensis]|uniref:ComEC/Rec2 family competence protein n=1 Tax=Saxibacter everestensis TaxID=2909229 RepID=A0ABY8QZT8_9MICO|nr:ComEC/Rec2 family competence protein [Brevibacteriaceae bacterium ZFBP1038]